MSQIRLYVDEDAQEHAVALGLKLRGIDIVTASEADLLGAEDSEQLEFAVSQSRVMYTFNVRHFSKLHCDYLLIGKSHAGIAVIPDQRLSIGEKIRRLVALVDLRTAEEMIDRLEYL